jgi:hypothetical protein
MSTTGDPDLAGAYEGERIFLIGNGPSLAETPLDALEDEYTMAMNRIDLIYDAVDWRPDFYICTRSQTTIRDALRESIELHVQLGRTRCFLDESWEGELRSDSQTIFLRSGKGLLSQEQSPNGLSVTELLDVSIGWLERFWSYEPMEIVYRFHTMYVAAQLAIWMGFEDIYLLGVDLGLDTTNYMIHHNGLDPNHYGGDAKGYLTRAYESGKLPSALLNGFAMKIMSSLIRSGLLRRATRFTDAHFTSSYADHVIPPNANEELRKSHVVIKRISDANGIGVYNATLGGELEVYPRVDLLQVLDG